MQVLLPDFALLQPSQKRTPSKKFRKIIDTKLLKRTQNRRNLKSLSTRTVTIQRTESLIANQNPNYYITQAYNTIILQSLPLKQQTNSNFYNSLQNPIHSKKTTKFIEGLLARGKSTPKEIKQRNRPRLVPSSPFLIAHSFKCEHKLQINPQIEQCVVQPPIIKQIKSKFPRKKVKSAFKSQQCCRPWSATKNSQIEEYIQS